MVEIRNKILDISYRSGACHIGSALSCVEILVAIKNKMKNGDFFIFSKASGISAWYSMSEEGNERLAEILKQYPLPTKGIAGIIHSVGSLGHGLPVAVGLAYSNPNTDVYCLMSDGEISEGTTWESLLFANHHGLDNLKIIIDRNGLQACGKTESILKLDSLEEKLISFGMKTCVVCGHDTDSIERVLQSTSDRPLAIIAETVKGKGFLPMEGNVASHYQNLNEPCQI
jgi:transketolase